MEPVTLDTFRRNAYRILGLQATATQEQLDSAARLMRLHADGDAPPTPNDALWLGPVPRGQRDIDDAVMRLTDPQTRTTERLWWFCSSPPATNTLPPLLTPTSGAAAKVCHRHDEALAALCRLLVSAAGTESLDPWRQLLSDCRGVASSEAYLQWQVAIEQSGDFEKQASPDEVAAAQSQMAARAATALVAIADGLVSGQAYLSAGRIIGMLRQTSGRNLQAREAAERILDRLEDALVGHCNDCVAQLSAAWETGQTYSLQSASAQAEVRCQSSIENLCWEILKWSAATEDRSQRVRGQVVKVYTYIADAYEACMDRHAARAALVKSITVAQGTPMEPRLLERIASLTAVLPQVAAAVTGNGGGNWSETWQDKWSQSGGSATGRRSSVWGKWLPILLACAGLYVVLACAGLIGRTGSTNTRSGNPPQFEKVDWNRMGRDLDQMQKDSQWRQDQMQKEMQRLLASTRPESAAPIPGLGADRPNPLSQNYGMPPPGFTAGGPPALPPQTPLSLSPLSQQNQSPSILPGFTPWESTPGGTPRGVTPQQGIPWLPSYSPSGQPGNSRGR